MSCRVLKWVRSAGCEDLHCVELRLPMAGCLSRGVEEISVKATLVPRLDHERPRRWAHQCCSA